MHGVKVLSVLMCKWGFWLCVKPHSNLIGVFPCLVVGVDYLTINE